MRRASHDAQGLQPAREPATRSDGTTAAVVAPHEFFVGRPAPPPSKRRRCSSRRAVRCVRCAVRIPWVRHSAGLGGGLRRWLG